ncbi:recombinase family protein [Sutcliffiella horikoshii]|uniref:Recombinase family protein n=1 Tax=Sutcliffiella horikoshii TaxID=79883 RepID=A0A5D4T1K3_9BACI|nr:recombinase family protein [Sutcliffiella horikoshii]TYS68841.1 recombinase family protein [Sutcliffiella horikoshii]
MIALYARVSTEEQAKSGYSLKDQIRQCRDKAGKNDEIMEYVDDGYSGEFLERPALTKLRNDVREGLINKVICYDPDRLSRKLKNQLILSDEIEKRAELIFVNSEYQKSPEGMLFYQMRGAIAEFEKAKINERMTRGRREKAKQGKVVKDAKVYGYKFNKDKGELEIYEPEAKVVRLIFELFTNPMGRVKGINGIAHYLMDKGIPTKKGKGVWHRQVVRQILMNETYSGVYYHNKWNTEGMLGNKYKGKDERIPMTKRPKEEWIPVEVPPIVEKETFEYAQKLLKESRRRWAGHSKNKYLLSGLLRCGDCGNTLTGRRTKNWGKYVLEYTDIKNTAGAKNPGCGNRIKCEELDEFVWNTFVNLMTTKGQVVAEAAVTVEEEETQSFEQGELERIEAELERIKMARQRLINFMVNNADIVDEEDIRNQMKELKSKEEHLTKLKEEVIEMLQNRQHEEFNEEILNETIEQYLREDNPQLLTIERKQDYLRKVFREIRIYSNGKVEFIRL